MEHIPIFGWAVIAFCAVLIFIIIMKQGIALGWGDKKMAIGKLNKKVDDSFKDEELRKTLFKKSIGIDEHLNADLRRTVRRMDSKISGALEQFFNSFLSITSFAAIIKDELNERIDYNNIREKLSSSERADYLYEIVKDIKNAFSTFVLHLQKSNKDEKLPEWTTLKKPVEQLIADWEREVVQILMKHIEEKIEMYEQSKAQFKTEDYVKTSITYPLEKNKKYLADLRG